VNGAWVCRKNDGSNHWRCPTNFEKIETLPRCVTSVAAAAPLPPPPSMVAANAAAYAKAAAVKAAMLKCPFVRYSNECEGKAYEAWLAAHLAGLEGVEGSAAAAMQGQQQQQGGGKHVLWLGNSHMGQFAEAAFCALRSSFVYAAPGSGAGGSVEATDMVTGCLTDRVPLGPHGCAGDKGCGFYLARAQLEGSGTLLLAANNHPWLFQGAGGMDSAMRHLLHQDRPAAIGAATGAFAGATAELPRTAAASPAADLSSVGTVFVGKWNPTW
jgi:hypothetical protein